MTERFEELAEQYKRNGKLFSVIMCDIDNFIRHQIIIRPHKGT